MDKPPVLLVDDNEATCTLITAVLAPEFNVNVASDGLEAIEKLQSQQYKAVLLDLLMPGMDGYGVLDFLRAERPDLLGCVIVVSAALTASEHGRLQAYPIMGVIAKPFEVDLLRDMVRHCAEAGTSDGSPMRGPFLSSGMILFIASVLEKQRWM